MTQNSKLVPAGFTLIELILVISIVSVLAVAAAERFLYYQERAEKAALESVLAGVKMGLQIRMAEMMMTNRAPQVVELETENPMRWLQEPPGNYAGEYAAPVKSGNWYYALQEHELVYVPTSASYLQWEQADVRELRFQVRVRYSETDTPSGKAKAPTSVAILPARPYRWF